MDINTTIKSALASGLSYAIELNVETLSFLPEVREMCASNRCQKYNKCWTCPPACGTLEEFETKAKEYPHGVIVQTVGEVEDSFDFEGFQRIEKQHKQNLEKLTDYMREQNSDFWALGAGGCTICETCTYPDAPCRFPERALTSMEASGLWISDICKKNGIPYNYGPNHMAYTSCILLK